MTLVTSNLYAIISYFLSIKEKIQKSQIWSYRFPHTKIAGTLVYLTRVKNDTRCNFFVRFDDKSKVSFVNDFLSYNK